MRWLQTLLGMGPARDVRAEVLARPVVHMPPPPYKRILGMDKPHLVRRYSIMYCRTIWIATYGVSAHTGDTPRMAYDNAMNYRERLR